METNEKKKVLERYHSAYSYQYGDLGEGMWCIFFNGERGSKLGILELGTGKTEQEAWKDAWDNIGYEM